MQVTKITEEKEIPIPEIKMATTGSLRSEYGYHMAQKLLKAMLDKRMLSVDEFNKVTEKNRQTFSPYLAEIMPKMT